MEMVGGNHENLNLTVFAVIKIYYFTEFKYYRILIKMFLVEKNSKYLLTKTSRG